MLKERDFRRLLSSVRELNQPRCLDEFRPEARRITSQLVEGERACFSEFDLQTGSVVVGLLEPVSLEENEQLFPLLKRHLHENPLVQRCRTQPDSAPARISDYLSRSDWHRTALYNEVYRHIDTEEQLFVSARAQGNVMMCITVHRSRRTFSERDCLLLEALRPHLMQAHAGALAWSKMQHELDCHSTIWNNLPTGMMLVSPQGRLIFCNVAGDALLQSYFGACKRQNALPAEIAEWLCAQRETSLLPTPPLRRQCGHRTLVARRLEDSLSGDEKNVLVLLEEEVQHSPLELLKTLGLTSRQSEVLLLLMRGQTNPQIAAQLTLSLFTVKRHLEAIYDKLQVSTRNAAAGRAHQTLAAYNDSPSSTTAFSLPDFLPEK